jgi:hypothetical protein
MWIDYSYQGFHRVHNMCIRWLSSQLETCSDVHLLMLTNNTSEAGQYSYETELFTLGTSLSI